MTTATPLELPAPLVSGEVFIDKRLYVEPMNDEWRLQIDVQGERDAGSLTERLDAAELEHELSDAFHDRLIVSGDGAARLRLRGDPRAGRARPRPDREAGRDARLGARAPS